MFQISMQNLGFSWPDGSRLFHDLNFSIQQEKIGLVGDNGCGKTTLLRLVQGLIAPSSGSITVEGKMSVVRQVRTFDPDQQVAAFLGVQPRLQALRRILAGNGNNADLLLLDDDWELETRIAGVMAEVGLQAIEMERPLRKLSGGELSRLALAAAWLPQPDFILLDEPSNHLDSQSRGWLYGMVRRSRQGLLVVSHDRALLREMDAILELGPAGLKRYGGNFDAYREQKEAQQAAAVAAYQSAQLRLKKKEKTAREARERQEKRTASADTRGKSRGIPKIVLNKLRDSADNTLRKGQALHDKRMEAARDELQAMKGKVDADRRIALDLQSQNLHASKKIFALEGINFAWPEGDTGKNSPLWAQPLNLSLHGSEKVWLRGPNGSGKSTLVKLIMKELEPVCGRVTVGVGQILLLDQQLSLLDLEMSLLDNLRNFAPDGMPEHELRTRLARFLFRDDKVFQRAKGLSGGEKMRLALACLLAIEPAPELLVLDEPTNNLDLRSLEELAGVLAEYPGAMLLITHDEDFAREVGVERTLELA